MKQDLINSKTEIKDKGLIVDTKRLVHHGKQKPSDEWCLFKKMYKENLSSIAVHPTCNPVGLTMKT